MPNLIHGAAVRTVYSLLTALLVGLAGCASRERAPDLAPAVQVSERTWQLVDRDIAAASLAATGPSWNYARGSMEAWRSRVRQRTEEDFIPWYGGYWTQQWLAIKVAWYQLGSGEGSNAAAKRLAAYLQEQYHQRVLGPVAEEIDPQVIRGQATALYVQLLSARIPAIPARYGVPAEQFEQRLKAIPAISLAPPAAHGASLFQLVHAQPIGDLPAYATLLAHVRKAGGDVGAGPSDARMSPLAEQMAERLVARLAIGGGASAAAAAVGGVAGMVISLGATGISAITHENQRPELEAQLRESLNAALDEMWHGLMENTTTGVMAAVYHISGQIAASTAHAASQAPEVEREAPEAWPPGGPDLPEQPYDDDGRADIDSADE
ncbi:MAG TPA: hypothetical protein PL117_03885 [Accumulibacter sp.]|uniref:hypothetical protein n=1 Tax=Accumulibacter sp. TaxID=2053492 RepID=UPI002D04E4A6|nr:hypothetical protein [Accumulibacter sp.]HRF71891.1 hypothetical protein [Accumulibacter sp.]